MVERRELPVGTRRFPVENTQDYKGTITFRPVKYTPPEVQGSALSSLFTRQGDGALTNLFNEEAAIAEGITGSTQTQSRTVFALEGPEATLDTTPGDTQTYVSASSSEVDYRRGVILYLPANIPINDNVNYESFELGAIGAIGQAGVQQGQGVVGALSRGVEQAAGSTIDLIRGNVGNQAAARLAATRLAQLGGNVAGGVSRSALAATVNPNSINLFRSVQLREFSFTFKMIANSPREAEEIDQIVTFFRATMYPETINFDPEGLNVPIGYEFPDKFQIEMRYNGERVGVRILNSVLRSVQTVFNPQSMSWHKDGKPSEVDITLNFGEERTLNRNDIFEGY